MNPSTSSTYHAPEIEEGGPPTHGHAISGLLPRMVDRPMTFAESRRVATLERRVPQTLERARAVGVPIEYLGTASLFNDARIYSGEETDWVFTPADASEALVPREQAQALRRLSEAGINMPLLYVAHEVPKDIVPVPVESTGGPLATMDRTDAMALVPATPPPATSVELSHSMDQRSQQVFHALARVAKVGAAAGVAAVAAPFLLVGAAAGALTHLDPIIVGAVPAVGSRPGDPATWWMLTKWDW